MPYVEDELSMLLVLPKAVDGLAPPGKALTPPTSGVAPALRKHEVNVYLPRFTMTSQFQLNEVLQVAGHGLGVRPGHSGLFGDGREAGLVISAVIHKAFVDVNEEGTEAAAATGVVMRAKAVRITPEFRADHPFVFLIRDNGTGAILFVGQGGEPKGIIPRIFLAHRRKHGHTEDSLCSAWPA